jgi:hypothetical protein
LFIGIDKGMEARNFPHAETGKININLLMIGIITTT